MSNWTDLRERVSSEIDTRRNIAAGTENFYRLQALKDVRLWIAELDEGSGSKPSANDADVRTVHGTGVDAAGDYEVTRYARAKKYRKEYSDGRKSEISLAKAVELTQKPVLGQPGGIAFDRAYQAASSAV